MGHGPPRAVAFLSQALLQPIFFLFVFGRVLPDIGAAGPQYGDDAAAGDHGPDAGADGAAEHALPLVIEFSFTSEIEDRLLAPLPTSGWARRRW